jgi:hypothetical protein
MTQQIIVTALAILILATRFLRSAAPAWDAVLGLIRRAWPACPAWALSVALLTLEQGTAALQGTVTPESLAGALLAALALIVPGAAARAGAILLVLGMAWSNCGPV